MLELKNICYSYPLDRSKRQILSDVSIKFHPGFNVILGPNGAGKSTLLKCIFKIYPSKGKILLNEKDISKHRIEQVVEYMSYLPQNDSGYCSMRALEVVLLGRLPKLGRKVTNQDLDIVSGVMDSLNIGDLAMSKVNELSGGQQKLVYAAQALVRKPSVILMDEPANSLDLQKQLELCHYLRNITIENNLCLIVVLHDLNLAARYADHIVIMNDRGKVYSTGPCEQVYTEQMLLDVYGVEAQITKDDSGVPVVAVKNSIRLTH